MNFHIKLVLVSVSLFSFTASAAQIPWSRSRPLQWSDFQGAVPSGSSFDAFTSSPYNCNANVFRGKITASCSVVFDTFKSWVKPAMKGDSHLLEHEQGHFSLTRACWKSVEDALKAVPTAGLSDQEIRTGLQKILDQGKSECGGLGPLYDYETAHGTDYSKQYEWNIKIEDALRRVGL